MSAIDKQPAGRIVEISLEEMDIVLAILRAHLGNREVLAFGSRATHSAKPFSDLDLAIMDDEPVPSAVLSDLHDAFDESVLPFKVDIVEWATTAESFKKIIRRDGVKIL